MLLRYTALKDLSARGLRDEISPQDWARMRQTLLHVLFTIGCQLPPTCQQIKSVIINTMRASGLSLAAMSGSAPAAL